MDHREPLSGPFCAAHEIYDFCKPIGADQVEKRILRDPRFPSPLFGGGDGAKRIWSSKRVKATLETMAVEGFPDKSPIYGANARKAVRATEPA